MELEELKLRQLVNQHLLTTVDCLTAVRDLCGVQAQFLSNALHALSIRSDLVQTDGLVKSWTIRGTIHLFAREDLPLFLHKDRSHFLRPCDTLEFDEWISKERKRYFADLILAGIAAGTSTREELKILCTAHGMTEAENESIFNPWGGTIRAMCENGEIIHKIREKKEFGICPPFEPMDAETAKLEMARRYFTHYAPATVRDAAYFFNATQKQVNAWLSQLPVTSAFCSGKEYFFIEPQSVPAQKLPDCLFLAGFDPLMMGYQKSESLYLTQDHLRGIFTLAGIVMPSVLLHGKVVGKWKQKGRQLTITLFEPVSMEEKNAIECKAGSLWRDLKTIKFLTA